MSNMRRKRVALVTGASSGIGREIAIQLASSGIYVCINYCKSESKALEVKRHIERFEGEAMLIKADITKEKEVKAMFQLIFSTQGSLDILVNNAGVYISDDIPTQGFLQHGTHLLSVRIQEQRPAESFGKAVCADRNKHTFPLDQSDLPC